MLETTKKDKSTPVVPRNVSFLNLARLMAPNWREYEAVFRKVAENARFIGGDELESFEENFAKWIQPGTSALGCGNGTDAITLAARALDLPEGSEAIVPAMTFMATVEGLMHAGLGIQLVDVQPGTWLLDLDQLENAITEKTKLIVPVHLYGQMVAMDRVREIADKHGLYVLEDAAQAHGARWKDQPVGHWGDIATYSFFPGKNLGAFGDGGAVLSRQSSLIQRVRALGQHGGLKKYQHDLIGWNSRLDNLQAGFLNVKLNYIDSWNEARRQVAKKYRDGLKGLTDLGLPTEDPNAVSVYHLFVVTVSNRADFMSYLKERGVGTGIHYPKAIHQQPAFAGNALAQQSFPHAEKLAECGVSLPMCPTLQPEEVDYVIHMVRSYFGK